MNEDQIGQIGDILSLFQIEKVLLLFFGIFVLAGLARLISGISSSLNKQFPARRLLIAQTITIINFVIYIFGGIFLFYGILRPPQALMIAAGGSIAVAVGLSLKDLAASVVAGLILLFDRPFQVGDRVTFGDTYGEIKSIGLRAVKLVTLDDSLVTIPNSRFLSDVVSSGNSGALDMMVVFDFYVALDADVQLAQQLLYDTIVTSRFVYLKKPVAIVVSEVQVANRLALQLKAKSYVLDVRFEKAMQTDLALRTNEVFRQHKIKRPLIEFTNSTFINQ
ncbi:MAG: mechanosensitive ion channel [Bdellovibrionaceae bacterium]|nr:mechanosensitive ion channel [Pseudobdellovibrionaceae bacterium]